MLMGVSFFHLTLVLFINWCKIIDGVYLVVCVKVHCIYNVYFSEFVMQLIAKKCCWSLNFFILERCCCMLKCEKELKLSAFFEISLLKAQGKHSVFVNFIFLVLYLLTSFFLDFSTCQSVSGGVG